jgi:5,10-methylenetetrahydromethanopterin reductase
MNDRIGLSYVISFGPFASKEMLQAAVLAERCGFDSVFVPEHYYDRESPSVLGAISQKTNNILIGTSVINPYTRYPSLIAMTALTLDELSDGRAFLGLGSGGVIGSLEHGIPNEFVGQKFSHPLGHLREVTQILRLLFSGETVNYEGKFYSLKGVKLNFRPVQERIPIYYGQQGPKMMELAGELADGVVITLCCTTQYVKDVIQMIKSSEARHNRASNSVEFAARIITSLSRNPKEAISKAKPLVGRVFIHPGARPVMESSGFELDTSSLKRAIETGRFDEIEKLISDEVVEMTTASGTKREILAKVEEFRKAGVDNPLIVPIGKNYEEIIRTFER